MDSLSTPVDADSPFVPTEPQGTDITRDLRRLHADELPSLAQRERPVVVQTVRTMVHQFIHFLCKTWSRFWLGVLFLPGTLLDKIAMLAFAFASSVIVGLLLVWCILAHNQFVHSSFRKWSRRYADGLSFANAAYPKLFHELSPEQSQHGRKALSQPMPPRHSHDTQTRIFNLDIAKILFQCSALMYEHTSGRVKGAIKTTREALLYALPSQEPTIDPSISQPGQVLQNAVGSPTAKQISAALHEDNDEESKMVRYAARLGLKYVTVSELNTKTSAVCGCFWDPKGNYIILAFKGTSPAEFAEWAGDFSYEPVDAGDYINGFGRVHGGFMERVFPRHIQRGAGLPYDTIRNVVRRTAAGLSQNFPQGTRINVWFTGHSLGTAVASLVYARALNEPHEFGPNIDLRDAYLFATPILADVQSVLAFHNRLNHDSRRTMWRITNGLDAVATALPSAGDHLSIRLSPYNLFGFAHLGMELTLREAPERSIVGGNAFANGTIVRIESSVDPIPTYPQHGVNPADKEAMEAMGVLRELERKPIIGRLVAHAPPLYWYMLQNTRPGECKWAD